MLEILQPSQVAAELHVSLDTVYRYIRNRRLAAYKVGDAYRIPRPAVSYFLARQYRD